MADDETIKSSNEILEDLKVFLIKNEYDIAIRDIRVAGLNRVFEHVIGREPSKDIDKLLNLLE